MATTTSIEWTDVTWNCVRGCARVSAGCEHCYAERVAYRFGQKPGSPYEGLTTLGKQGPRWVGRARFVPELLGAPLSWRKPRRVFVNSMSDLFHEDVTNDQIAAVFGIMASCPQHTFQVLTKRPSRMLKWFEWLGDQHPDPRTHVLSSALSEELRTGPDSQPLHAKHCADPDGPWPLPNVWLGVSCETQDAADDRISVLLECPAAVRFISAEPLLEELGLFAFLPSAKRNECLAILNQGVDPKTAAIDWVIVGGESGPGARHCRMTWIESIVRQCDETGVPCFVKQLGADPWDDCVWRGVDAPMGLSSRKGGDPGEWPLSLRVRQFPEVRR